MRAQLEQKWRARTGPFVALLTLYGNIPRPPDGGGGGAQRPKAIPVWVRPTRHPHPFPDKLAVAWASFASFLSSSSRLNCDSHALFWVWGSRGPRHIDDICCETGLTDQRCFRYKHLAGQIFNEANPCVRIGAVFKYFFLTEKTALRTCWWFVVDQGQLSLQGGPLGGIRR